MFFFDEQSQQSGATGSSLPILGYEIVHQFAENAPLLLAEAFRFNGADYAGVQPSAWESSELSWDNGEPTYLPPNMLRVDPLRGFGCWIGPGQVHIRPGELNVAPLDDSEAALEFAGHDDLARVTLDGDSALLRASWTHLNPGFAKVVSGVINVILQDAATGDILDAQLVAFDADHADLPTLGAHAILWARFENVARDWQLPPDYLSVRGFSAIPDRFKYTEGESQYVWDYEADVGRRPSDPDHSFYALQRQAFEDGDLDHRGAWTQYISDGATAGGPWSALRIAVGESDFAVGADFQPAPGAVLYELTDEDSRSAVLIDPQALSITASAVLKQGDDAGLCRIGGTLAGRSGPVTAYWNFHPAAPVDNLSATLLGTNENNFVNTCEASLYPVVSDILEIPQPDESVSRELVLTHSHLYEYTPDGATIPTRLPGLPRATLGHPGGRCLRTIDSDVRFFTEYFGLIAGGQFYNTLRTIDPRQRVIAGSGTVFHGDNCAEVCFGDFYGWQQTKNFGEADAQQYLGWIRDGAWNNAGMAGFPAAAYRWQRLRAVNAAGRTVLMACGKSATSEAAIWGVANGEQFREASLDFRPRRLTRVVDEDGIEWLYCVGRFVSQDENLEWGIAPQWSVIRLSGTLAKQCVAWDEEDEAFTVPRTEAEAAGLDTAKLPLYLWWHADALAPAGGYWIPGTSAPGDDRPYLILSATAETIRYGLPIDGTLPYNPFVWNRFCFTVHVDGGTDAGPWPPLPTCDSAACVVDPPYEPPEGPWPPAPTGLEAIIITKAVTAGPWAAVQVCDTNPLGEDNVRLLRAQNALFPNLWLRVDSSAASDDLDSYTIPCPWDRFISLPQEARARIDVVALVEAGGEYLAPSIIRRN